MAKAAAAKRVFALDDKFWEVWVDGVTMYTRSGKVGSNGQTKLKKLGSSKEVAAELERVVKEKTKQGFVENVATEAAAAPAAIAEHRNPTLEKAILANPEDADAYSVYGDWLHEQGDPRGELIALMLANKGKAAQALLEKHAAYFLGPLAAHVHCYDDWPRRSDRREAFRWKYGFIHGARLAHDYYANSEFKGSLREVLELLLAHPSGKFLTQLIMNYNKDPSEDTLQDLIDVLAKRAPPTLREIEIGDDVSQISWYHVGDLGPLWKGVPNLATLKIHAGSFSLGNIQAPSLVRAEFITGGLSKAAAKSIAKASWPKIEYLDVYYGDDQYGGDASIADVRPLLDRKDLTALRHLGLMNSMFADELADAIGGANVIRGLRELDLSHGIMTDDGARALAATRDKLAHLEVLNVSENYLTRDGIKALKGCAKKVIADSQKDDDDPEYRMVSVAE
jgi:uncharacterized protein (TIGR02996 family)